LRKAKAEIFTFLDSEEFASSVEDDCANRQGL